MKPHLECNSLKNNSPLLRFCGALLGIILVFTFNQALIFAEEADGGRRPAEPYILERPIVPESMEGRESESRQAEPELSQEEGRLRRNFRDLVLGMDYQSLIDALKKDTYFAFRGERDVSLLPLRNETLIEVAGTSYIRRAYFQLDKDGLYIISLSLSPDYIDHYSLFTHFVSRYGEPETLNPRLARWEDEYTSLSLERPLPVKYIDKSIFDARIADSEVREAQEVELREEFLDEF